MRTLIVVSVLGLCAALNAASIEQQQIIHDTDRFDITIKPGCDSVVTNFAPKSWRMDRGLLVVLSERNDPWRFEEEESGTWHRVPQGRQPLLWLRQ